VAHPVKVGEKELNMNAPIEVVIYEAQLVEWEGQLYKCYRIDIPSAPYRERTRYWYFGIDQDDKEVETFVNERYHPAEISWQLKLPF
jgi:hypothetical protein